MKKTILLTIMTALLAGACGDGSDSGTGGTPRTPVASVEVTAPAPTVEAGATMQLSAAPRAGDGTVLAGRAVAWSSSAEAVATVSQGGLVSAHAAGTAVITAASEGREGKVTIIVQAAPQPVAAVEITGGPLALQPGGTGQLAAVARAGDNTVLAGRAVAWTSSAEAVATVSPAGVVSAHAAGTVVVTATVEGKTAQATVIVAAPVAPVASVRITLPLGVLMVGEAAQLRAQPSAADGSPLDRPVAWASENPGVASVDASGRVTAHAAGTARIRATSEGTTGTAEVRVETWTEHHLLAVGDSALPATLLVQPRTAPDGTVQHMRWVATEGRLRLGAGRFEQAFMVWMYSATSLAVQAQVVYAGTYERSADGTLVFQPYNAAPRFTARALSDGRLSITRRLEPFTAEVTLTYAAP